MIFPVSAIGWTASMTQRAVASQRRINEFLHITPTIKNAPGASSAVLAGSITFSNVDFTYPHTGIQALTGFDLQIRKGEKIAIVGKTGSGKSTIAQLMLRMYDVDKGSIAYDGIEIKKLLLQDLRDQVSYVPQDVFLFSDTVRNNIKFGNAAASDADVDEAAKNACIYDEIMSFADKMDTVVGERGVTLSGGQKQRISIARALLKDPNIVIFDDCLSAVDARTEKRILGNLYNYLQQKTAVIITHRIFSLFDFDRIIVLENGTIAEMGTHAELLKQKGIYAEMYLKQQKNDREGMGE